MPKNMLRLRLVDDDGRVARALAQGRFELVSGRPGAVADADLVVSRRARCTVLLTPRELEVLSLVAVGATNHAIGSELFIAENTVKNHVRSILLKFGARTRTQAVVMAHRQGLVNL